MVKVCLPGIWSRKAANLIAMSLRGAGYKATGHRRRHYITPTLFDHDVYVQTDAPEDAIKTAAMINGMLRDYWLED